MLPRTGWRGARFAGRALLPTKPEARLLREAALREPEEADFRL